MTTKIATTVDEFVSRYLIGDEPLFTLVFAEGDQEVEVRAWVTEFRGLVLKDDTACMHIEMNTITEDDDGYPEFDKVPLDMPTRFADAAITAKEQR